MPRLMGLVAETVPVSRSAAQELVAIALGEWRVPGDFDAEALVLVAAQGKVGAEEHGELDVGFLRDAAQQRGLVLDGMADEIGESQLRGLAARGRGAAGG